jgi:predicted unusual protein kinase regulating ubiquinone biosynthesis (AarF/ABC1/UbiB family)
MHGRMPVDLRLPPALASLIESGRRLAAEAPSAKVTLARLDGLVRPELVPEALRSDVGAAIDRVFEATARPLPASDVEKILRSAWGRPPACVLNDIDLDAPVAVRPHAQTHRGVVDGSAVAVKLVRPRLAASARADLVLLDALARPLGAAFPALDVGPVLREVRERVLDELDLEHEGEVQRRVARGLRRVDGVTVARVDAELTTHEVHVSEWLDGPTLAESAPDDGGAVARMLVRVFVGAPRAIGLVLANPRPSDVVLLPAGGVGLIGPSAARPVSAGRVDAWIATLGALQARDADAFAAALAEQGLLSSVDDGRAAYGLIEATLGPLLLSGPARLDDAALAAAGARALDALGDIMEIAGRATPDPDDLWPLRMLAQLAATLAPVGATEDWLALALAALRDGWT